MDKNMLQYVMTKNDDFNELEYYEYYNIITMNTYHSP